PGAEQRAKARALVLGVEDPADVARLVPAVERTRADVEIAAQERRLAGRVVGRPVRREHAVPGELAREIGVPDRLAVRAVDARHREPLDPRTDETRAEVRAGQPDLHGRGRLAREHGHAVPTLLAVDHRVVAERLDLRARKLVVAELELLE